MSKRYLTALFIALLLSGGRAAAQRPAQLRARYHYWDAHLDSLRRVLATQRTDTARLRTLRHLLDVINPSRIQFTRDFAAEAAGLSTRLHRPEARAYRLLAAATQLRATNLSAGLDSMRAAIAAMDELHHPVPTWLFGTRILYDDLERQQARRAFFDAKRAYYQQRGDTLGLAACYHALGDYYGYRGDFNRAIGCFLRAADLYRPFKLAGYYNALAAAGIAYADWGNQARSLHYLRQVLAAPPALAPDLGYPNRTIAQIYLRQRNYPAAWQALARSMRPTSGHTDSVGEYRLHLFNLAHGLTLQGEVLLAQGRAAEAGPLLRRAQYLGDSLPLPLTSVVGNFELDATWAKYYLARGQAARAEAAWQTAYRKARHRHSAPLRLVYLRNLAQYYQGRGQPRPAATYALAAALLADTLANAQGAFHLANYEAEQADRAQQARIAGLRQTQQREEARARRQRRVLLAVLGGAALLLGLAAVLYHAFRRSEHLTRLVTAQKQDLQTQRDQLDASLTNLRQTQAQLIQKEKMASLGELTAGIAHEIQNPLNFVNNFSEVSAELVEELAAAQQRPTRDAALATELLADLRQNLGKIAAHGRRAAGIVRSMLEHSRASTGERLPTDLNALADEYLRLAYQGLRAKDKGFSATLTTDFAPGLPLAEAVGADLGRVLLNLFNNAFYAVQQRQQASEAAYVPTVSVRTRRVGQQVEMQVADNGTGMPPAVQAKIFQPFFTTKPTGEGTGLGLSLSYDIVTQGHHGTLTVESQVGQGSTFHVCLPALSQ
jgi:two-component system NtrC family sensor kinase